MCEACDQLDLERLTEIVWEIGQRIRQNMACEPDIEALLAIEFVARTPALKRLANGIVDQAMMTKWADYILNYQLTEMACQQPTF
jgi:hypothetical protein